jgi:hypothetical protein
MVSASRSRQTCIGEAAGEQASIVVGGGAVAMNHRNEGGI